MTDMPQKRHAITRRAAFAGLGLAAAGFLVEKLGLPIIAAADNVGATFDALAIGSNQWIVNLDRANQNVPFLMRFFILSRTIDYNAGTISFTMKFDKQVSKPWATDGSWRVYYNKHHIMYVDGHEIGQFGPGHSEEVVDWGSIRHESGAMSFTMGFGQTVHIHSTGYNYDGHIEDVGMTNFNFYLKANPMWTVTFKAGWGTNATIKTEKVVHGGNATAPADPTREGHTFVGWDRGYTNVTSDITVTAQWRIDTFTVTFKSGYGDDATLKTEVVDWGSGATAPTPPARTGYTFTGWDKSFDVIKQDTVVTARWRPNAYTIVFHGNGSEVAGSTASMSMTYDVAKSLNKCGFTRDTHEGTGPLGEALICHWRFKGWAKTSTGDVAYTDGQSVVNLTATDGGIVDMYAVWEAINGWGNTRKRSRHRDWIDLPR